MILIWHARFCYHLSGYKLERISMKMKCLDDSKWRNAAVFHNERRRMTQQLSIWHLVWEIILFLKRVLLVGLLIRQPLSGSSE
jgi:hypothetical protein